MSDLQKYRKALANEIRRVRAANDAAYDGLSRTNWQAARDDLATQIAEFDGELRGLRHVARLLKEEKATHIVPVYPHHRIEQEDY